MTFALGESGTRVHVALQGAGSAVRLIAVCPASSRAAVVRALDEARFALGGRGIALTTEIAQATHAG
jgi:hypothetical protein